MKERSRKGTFRSTESIQYKMTQHHGFDQVSWLAFQEAAREKYDFATCQRPDGSYYGTGGTCRKGSEVKGGVSKKEKSVASKRAKDLKRRGADGENHGKQVKNSGGGDAVAPAPKKTTKKDPVKNVLNEQKKTKDFLKKDNAQMGKDNPKAAMATLKAKNKKLSEEYERLRGDNSPQATKRRKEIMDASNKNVKAQKDLSAKMDAAAKSQSPAKAPDRSPAGQQRRANAAARGRD